MILRELLEVSQGLIQFGNASMVAVMGDRSISLVRCSRRATESAPERAPNGDNTNDDQRRNRDSEPCHAEHDGNKDEQSDRGHAGCDHQDQEPDDWHALTRKTGDGVTSPPLCLGHRSDATAYSSVWPQNNFSALIITERLVPGEGGCRTRVTRHGIDTRNWATRPSVAVAPALRHRAACWSTNKCRTSSGMHRKW